MTPVLYTEEEAYNAADLSLGLSQKNKTRACLKWHCAFVMWISDGDREVWSSTELQCKINSVSHWKHDMAYLSVTAHKKTHHALFHFTAIRLSNRRCSTCASDQIIKVKAYVNFCKKIIYPSTSLYKVCSKRKKRRIFVPWHWVIVKSKERERRVESSSSVTTTPSSEKLFLIQMNGAKVGAKESGHHAACNHLSEQHWTHVFVRDQGRV